MTFLIGVFSARTVKIMAFCVRFEDRLDGISNYLQWKVRIAAVLKENKIWNFVNTVVVSPKNDPISLDLHEIKEAKAQTILLDGAKEQNFNRRKLTKMRVGQTIPVHLV